MATITAIQGSVDRAPAARTLVEILRLTVDRYPDEPIWGSACYAAASVPPF